MNLRFSLLGLISLVTLSALACAALVNPGVGWLSVVVSLTAAAAAGQLLRAIFANGQTRAAAVGWLVFAIGYLAIVTGPWLGQHVGPQLASTKALLHAQVHWRKEDPRATVAEYELYQQQIWSRVLLGNSWSFINVDNGVPVVAAATPQAAAVNYFQLSGQWLVAWLAGWLGAALAVHFERRRTTAAGKA